MSENEGEFKKRIIWLDKNPEKDAGRLISQVTASAFLEIIEDAKKEYPTITAYQNLSQDELALISTMEKEYNGWFKKWFGR